MMGMIDWKGRRMPNSPPESYNLKFSRPLARWRELAPNHLAYAIEGLDKDKTAFAWNCPSQKGG
jgi:hypothetical protein